MDDFENSSSSLLLLVVSFLRLTSHVILDYPKSGISKERSKISSDGHQEIVVVKVEDLLNRVFSEDSHKPDLLAFYESSSSMVHSVLSHSIHKSGFQFNNPRLMHVSNFFNTVSSQFTWRLLHIDVHGSEKLVVLLEEGVHLIEESNTSQDSLNTILVGLHNILFRSIDAVD